MRAEKIARLRERILSDGYFENRHRKLRDKILKMSEDMYWKYGMVETQLRRVRPDLTRKIFRLHRKAAWYGKKIKYSNNRRKFF